MSDARLYFALGTFLALLLVRRFRSRRHSTPPPLPPGPKPWPLIGNMLDLPPKGQIECFHWMQHKDLYGSISSISVLGQTIILLHDRQAVSDLFEKKATNYSDRPTTTLANEM